MNKRILALLLALVMAVGALPTGAWAADTGDTLVVSDSETKVVTAQQQEQASTKVATATKNTGGKPTQTQSQTVGESGDGPSTFETNTFYWNVSKDDCYQVSEPKPAKIYTGEQEYWFNIWWTGSRDFTMQLFIKKPGEKRYRLELEEDLRYWEEDDSNAIGVQYTEKINKTGTLSYYWRMIYRDGSVHNLDITNVSVSKGNNYVCSKNCSHARRNNGIWYHVWEKEYSSKAKSFYLNAVPTEGKIIGYKSRNKKIAVNNKGKVTIAKKFVGRAIIDISLPATKNFNKSKDPIVIAVKPQKPIVTKLSSPKKGQMKISWKKDTSVSGYTIEYSTDKEFLKGKYIDIKKNSVSSVVVKGMKSRKKYYVKMYSYKSDKSWYDLTSEYSKTKTIKVK